MCSCISSSDISHWPPNVILGQIWEDLFMRTGKWWFIRILHWKNKNGSKHWTQYHRQNTFTFNLIFSPSNVTASSELL